MRQHGGRLDPSTKERFQKEQLQKEGGGITHQEEYAAEITAPSRRINYAEPYKARNAEKVDSSGVQDEEIDELVEAVTRNKAVGYMALFVALASLFVWPVLLGVSGIVLGVIAFLMGNKRLGTWSVILGFIAVAAYFLLVPFYA